jgi:predicted Zn-dependent protease with MMP-like domain
MISIDEMQELLDSLAEEFPEEFFHELSGGIVLVNRTKRGAEDGLYILGEYIHGGGLGRHIAIYYGSFERVYAHLNRSGMKAQLRETLSHEFTHHLESMAGVRDLEAEDERQLAEYRSRKRKRGKGSPLP